MGLEERTIKADGGPWSGRVPRVANSVTTLDSGVVPAAPWKGSFAFPGSAFSCGEVLVAEGVHGVPRAKRGVLLLVALVMLSLFMLLGTSYILIANRRRPCSAAAGVVGSKTESAANETVDSTKDVLTIGLPDESAGGGGPGLTATERFKKFFQSSILADKYGDWYEETRLNSIAAVPLKGTATPTVPFYTIDVAGLPTFGPATTIAEWQKVSGKSPDLGSHVGRLLSIESDVEPNAVFRVVAKKGTRYLAHLANPAAEFDHRNLAANAVVSIQGREFSGDPDDTYDLHENYDAPDNRNWFLAWVQTDAVLGRDQQPGSGDEQADGHRFVVPSFHRPDKLLAAVKGSPANFYNDWLAKPISLLRPAGKMSWDPAVDWTKYGLASAPTMPSGNALEHPNFTGGNVRNTPAGTQYFDPIHGPWDVDNDGDGVTDSIWLDVGMSPVAIGSARVQPLVAMMVLDLDGRVNLNAHGTHLPFDRTRRRPVPNASMYRYAGTVSSTASGTAGPKQAVLPPAQGWGVADIDPRRVFLSGGGDGIMTSLLQGSGSTGSSTPGGRLTPSIKAEGRLGDSAGGTASLAPAPGILARNDPGIDAPASPARDGHVPNTYAEPVEGLAFQSPADPQGISTVGLDQMGQPYIDRLRVGESTAISTAGSGPGITLGTGFFSLPRWAGDRIDDPYDVSLGRRAPRPGWAFDPDVQSTPSTLQDNLFTAPQFERLLRLFEPAANALSPRLVSLLGQSAETARVTSTIESWDTPAVTIPRSLLEPLLALSDQADATRPSLVSWDLAMGLRMDVNRPFGDGRDSDGDGIVDEPGEYAAEVAADVYGMKGSAFEQQCLTNGRDVDGKGGVDGDDQKLARELFARHLYVLARSMAPTLPAKDAAQWAVNVVDMRDPDGIITRFQFDPNSPGNSSWQLSADASKNVVWGCERPDLLLTEAMAWRNVSADAVPGANAIQYSDKGTGGLVIEVYHPWVGVTSQGTIALADSDGSNGKTLSSVGGSEVFYNPPTVVNGKHFDREYPMKLDGFQIVAVPEEEVTTLTRLTADPTWPTPAIAASGSIPGLVIHLGQSGTIEGSLGTFRCRPPESDPTAIIRPGSFALVSGPIESGTGKALVNWIDVSASGTASMLLEYSDNFRSGTAPVLQFSAGFNETITGSNGFDPADRLNRGRYPDNPSSGPVTGLVCVQDPAHATSALRFPPKPGKTVDLSYMANERYRILLRRLANPREAYDPVLNPYICVDSLVVQDQAIVAGAPGPGGVLKSAERCAAQPADKSVNNIWRHSTEDDDAYTAALAVPIMGPVTGVEDSLGFLPARLKVPSNADDPDEVDQPVFPWLTWLNREFVSPHELLLVPRSSPATLLRDHTHEWPFKHLFFQLGSGSDAAANELEQRKIGILELLRVPSRFADAETWVPPAEATGVSNALVGLGGRPMFLPPHNYLSHFREPGRVNLNTMSSSAVWSAMNNGFPCAPYEDEVAYASDGKPVPFEKSEDWSLESGGRSSPASGDWTLDAGEDKDGDGKLDVNHDENNDGRRQVSKSGMLCSIAASRRGWPLANDGSTPAIAGQFDRVLNRTGLTDLQFFSKPFQSGWSTGAIAYDTDKSLLLRNWTAHKSGASFTYGFKHINAPDADRYLIDSTGMRRFSEWDSPPTTYWGASANGAEGRLIYKFDFGSPTSAIRLKAHLPTWDFGGGNRGASSLEVSKDGNSWISIHNNLEPRKWGEMWSIDGALPAGVVGSNALYVRMRFYTEGAPIPSYTVAQFGRSTSAAPSNVFEVNADLLTDGEAGPVYLMATNLALKDSKGGDQDGRPYADPRRNPYFRYREMMRLSNLSTQRSNVFAVWMTVGFFVIEPHPTNAGQSALGAEYGLDTGDAVRFKSFMIFDRSIPVGFRPGTPLNSRDAVLLDHFGN